VREPKLPAMTFAQRARSTHWLIELADAYASEFQTIADTFVANKRYAEEVT
jgi:hypothetical protein